MISKKIDLLLIILSPILATILTLIFETNLLTSTLLYFGLPSFYLAYRKSELVPKSLLSALFIIPFAIVVDYLALLDQAWYVPTIFNFRILGTISLEDFIFGYLWAFFGIMFYEHFLDQGKKGDKFSKNVKYFVILSSGLLTLFFLFLCFRPDLLYIEYLYLKVGIALSFIPLVTFLIIFPKLWTKFIKMGIYFFCLNLLFELTALYLGQWTFPGHHYIGFIELLELRFPFEEFLIWLVLGVPTGLVYYEFFIDDRK